MTARYTTHKKQRTWVVDWWRTSGRIHVCGGAARTGTRTRFGAASRSDHRQCLSAWHRSTRPPVVLCDVQHASDMAILQQQKKLNHTLTMPKLVRQQPL